MGCFSFCPGVYYGGSWPLSVTPNGACSFPHTSKPFLFVEVFMTLRHSSCIILILLSSTAAAQLSDYRTHQRGLLHQTVYNTGELGRTYDDGVGGIQPGFSSLEWPPNSSLILNRTLYRGQHNSFGGGLRIAGTKPSGRQYMFCGAISDANGNPLPVEGRLAEDLLE